MPVQSIGSPNSSFYVVCLTPSEDDAKAGVILSGSQGYEFGKWNTPSYAYRTFILTSLEQDDTALDQQIQDFIALLNKNKPPVILALGNKTFQILCPQYLTRKRYSLKKTEALKSSLLSYHSGSLCTSPLLTYEHYIVPTMSVTDVWKQWDQRDEVISIDVARAVEEHAYFRQHNKLNELPRYNLLLDPPYQTVIDYLEQLCSPSLLDPISIDIETLMPKRSTKIFKSTFEHHPGFPYTIALAPSQNEVISFYLWRYDSPQLVKIFKLLDYIFTHKKIIGQNFFSYDVNMLEAAFGFSFNLHNIYDTKLRHHILWPELPHKLQFLTKQYTRQPYYKDEGKNFSPKNQAKLLELLHYGGLDVCVTYQVFLGQEKEFEERPWLK